MTETAEHQRLQEEVDRTAYWRRWGPYLSERQWGTVREDYSEDGDAWNYFPHEHARSRAYRWGEDGLAGYSDNHQHFCFSLALWNEKDKFIKERAYGLNGHEGNHAEDVKEYYYYLDNTPTHAYMKYLYKYPQAAFPYEKLIEKNKNRSRKEPEYELIDTGVFDDDRYFDVFVEYAKADPEDTLISIQAFNRGPDPAPLHLLPTLWFRNTWTWKEGSKKPMLQVARRDENCIVVEGTHPERGQRWLYCENPDKLLFTENETNHEALYNDKNESAYVKDGINRYIIDGVESAVNPRRTGTKMSAHYSFVIPPGKSQTIRLRLSNQVDIKDPFGKNFSKTFSLRLKEADEFYAAINQSPIDSDMTRIERQAYAGLLWSKQFYHYIVEDWLNGDPGTPPPPEGRKKSRNHEWRHLYNSDILSMPDKWEYPWFAAWDLAFHMIPFAVIDSDFAKKQLLLLTREWYMHPNGQIPAYEWAFDDVNPPVHAWAAWRVYKIEKKQKGKGDLLFLEKVFQKVLMNFTWWVNRKDSSGNNVFEGGFLGLDNIGVFDRSKPLPMGGSLEQADGTSWMAMFSLNMLTISLELALEKPAYEDIASKFFEHFIHIVAAINNIGEKGTGLWNEEDGYYYDMVNLPNGEKLSMKAHSLVGLIPLFATETIDQRYFDALPEFKKRFEWFLENRPDLIQDCASMSRGGPDGRRLLSIVGEDKLRKILRNMLDESRLLSPYGIRSVSKIHEKHPLIFHVGKEEYRLDYEPGESQTHLFGGNSNWRGPVWFPINYLLVETLQKLHHYHGDDFKVECPVGSGIMKTLWEISLDLAQRMTSIFLTNEKGERPVFGIAKIFQEDPHWKDHILFYEYFHGDSGEGLGASHQTGWTGLVAKLVLQFGEYELAGKKPVLYEE
jgi:hypothetical protein